MSVLVLCDELIGGFILSQTFIVSVSVAPLGLPTHTHTHTHCLTVNLLPSQGRRAPSLFLFICFQLKKINKQIIRKRIGVIVIGVLDIMFRPAC